MKRGKSPEVHPGHLRRWETGMVQTCHEDLSQFVRGAAGTETE